MLIIEQQQLSLITVQSQVLWRKEGDDKTTIDISRDKIIGPKKGCPWKDQVAPFSLFFPRAAREF